MAPEDLPTVRSGFRVGVSVSASEDLGRFGVTETHVRMALGEIARGVLLAGGHLVYGGHLEEDGYSAFLLQEVRRSGRRDRPFTGYVPLPVHEAMHLDEIEGAIEDLSVLGTYRFLDSDGREIDPRQARGPEPVETGSDKAAALSAARSAMSEVVDGRVAVGGRRSGYSGRMPGVVEEVILAMRHGTPVFIAGGYGGVAGDMAVALGIDDENWLRLEEQRSYTTELLEVAADVGWEPGSNGLDVDENRRLAVTYRASEAASLIVTGLSRLMADQ
jgi:hypothetical protein